MGVVTIEKSYCHRSQQRHRVGGRAASPRSRPLRAGDGALRHQHFLSDPQLDKCNGSALNQADVAGALRGVDAVVMALGIPAGPEMVLGPVRLFSEATAVVVAAMRNTGVRRLICVTGFGAGDSRAAVGCLQGVVFRMFLGRAYNDKDIQEQIIRTSGLDWVIARSGILTSGSRTGSYKALLEPKTWRNGVISRADVADFLVKQIDDNALLGRAPVLAY